jgi:aminopeptidase N
MVFTDVLFKEADLNFNEGAYFSKIIVEYLSNELPGVQFPYSHITSFCNGRNGGGMESPMMTNDGALANRVGLFSLLLHEIAHTYFPFYMGINERKYGWMDEGWATFLTKDLVSVIDSNRNQYEYVFGRFGSDFGEETEVPLMILSNQVKGNSLTAAIYGRAFFAYVALQDLLGEDLFKKALKEYIHRWAGKHPLPYDFFLTFNDVANEDLSWFWKPWFYEFGYCDVGVEQNIRGEYVVKLSGNRPVSVQVKIVYEDGSQQDINENPSIWQNRNTEYVLNTDENKKIKSVEINDDRIPDLNPGNNYLVIE